MQKLFVDFMSGDKVTLDREQSRHIAKSLRMKKGDMLTLSCRDGNDYGCIIDEISDIVTLSVCYKQANFSEADVSVTLCQGMPKSNKLEDVIQKCTELEICRICPVLTHRSISRPDEKSADKKLLRWRKIALEAAQQSGRGIIPEVSPLTSLEAAVKNDGSTLKIIFYEGGGERLAEIIPQNGEKADSISIYIGPEGGFKKREVELLLNNNAVAATLGPRILRT
ncbi:MAG: 16S rRNA (uracil(1498)-N(3))-methyltransferase [Clostridiales bacterium]|nr:16S rRNA (uracil(1498)-N(3))-methyltransferase [Clostridiales bacterium]